MINSILCNYGYIIDKNNLSSEDIKKIKDDLTVEPKLSKQAQMFSVNKSNDNKFKIYQEGKNKMILPTYYGLEHFGIPSKIVNSEYNKLTNIKFVGKLREKQEYIINKIKSNYFTTTSDISINLKQYGGGILSVPPGQGKTVMALYLINLLKLKTLIIVHKSFLVNQWVERINQYLQNVSIGYLYQNNIDIDNKDIVIGMLQSISMKNYDEDIFSEFNFVIFDEVHHLGAKIFSQALLKIQSNFTLGLSATPSRKDCLEKVFYWYLGPQIHYDDSNTINNVNVLLYKYKLSEQNEYFKIKIVKTTKTVNYSRMISNLTKIDKRNKFILKLLIELSTDSNKKILLLSNIIEHLRILFDMVKKNIPNISCGLYIGGMKQDKLKETENKQIILASYAMASEGLDIKDLNTLILATPRSDITQSIGRILRKKHALVIPTIHDIIDNISVFNAQSKKRISHYNNNNYDLSYINVIDENIITDISEDITNNVTETVSNDLFID